MTPNPILVGLAIAMLSVIPAWLAYRTSRKRDSIAEQAGIATTQSTSIAQVVDGLNTHIENLRKDNADLRVQLAELRREARTEIAECNTRIAFLEEQIHRYRREDEETASTRLGEDATRATERADEQKE